MVAELSGQGHAVRDLLEAAGLARSSYYYALAHPPAANQSAATSQGRPNLFTNPQRVRSQADSHVPAR